MIILVEGFYLHGYVSVFVHCMGRCFFNVILQNHARLLFFSKKKKVVPLLTFGLFSLIFCYYYYYFILFSCCWFGEAIPQGCKTKTVSKK